MENTSLNEDGLIRSSHYGETMVSVIQPALASQLKLCEVTGRDGANLSCALFRAASTPIGTLVLLHGFTESWYKYSELIYSLLFRGWNVISYDQRGHGASWRKPGLSDVGDTHVDQFEDYVDDLKTICDTFLPSFSRPWMVFGHSMGGAVVSLFLERYPDVFTRAVLCAPMIAPDLGGAPYALSALLCQTARFLGKGAKRVFFFKPYSGPEEFATSCATDPARFAWYDGVRETHPEYQNCSATYAWSLEAMRVTKKLLAPGAPEGIICPVRLYAADEDHSVLSEPQKQFISRVPHGERVFVPKSRHEIYRSTDDVLFPWWHEILAFLQGGTSV